MIRVLVVEEVRAIGEIIATVLRSESTLAVVGCASSLDEAATSLRACDVALVNACMTTEASVGLVHGLRRLAPWVKIMVMGLARSPRAILQCVEAGVVGYVLRDSSVGELLRSIRAAGDSEGVVAPPLGAAHVDYLLGLGEADAGGEPEVSGPRSLTRREREVLGLVQQGLTNQEIAASLVIELGTVKNHVHNILRKLNVNSRRDAVQVSRLAGWSGQRERGLPWGQCQPDRQLERASLFGAAVGANN